MSATSHYLASLDDTQALAQRIAPALRAGDTLLLSGDLGTGKTTFAQALIRTLGGEDLEVTSPTFTLVQHYPMTIGEGGADIFHYDLYRIEHPNALQELGMEDTEHAIRIIEWPQRLGHDFAPDSWLSLHFTLAGTTRHVATRSAGPIAHRLQESA